MGQYSMCNLLASVENILAYQYSYLVEEKHLSFICAPIIHRNLEFKQTGRLCGTERTDRFKLLSFGNFAAVPSETVRRLSPTI